MKKKTPFLNKLFVVLLVIALALLALTWLTMGCSSEAAPVNSAINKPATESVDNPVIKPPATEPVNDPESLNIIKMDNLAYAEHKKSIVIFSHKKHTEEYKAGCGECHHDDKGRSLDNLKEGDAVQGCMACHKIPSERPKGKDVPKLTKEERLEYHAEALHYNCKDCHKKFNKETKTKKAPTTCTKCHVKK